MQKEKSESQGWQKHFIFGQVKYSAAAGYLHPYLQHNSSYIWLLPDLPCMESTTVMGSRRVLLIHLVKESLYIKLTKTWAYKWNGSASVKGDQFGCLRY